MKRLALLAAIFVALSLTAGCGNPADAVAFTSETLNKQQSLATDSPFAQKLTGVTDKQVLAFVGVQTGEGGVIADAQRRWTTYMKDRAAVGANFGHVVIVYDSYEVPADCAGRNGGKTTVASTDEPLFCPRDDESRGILYLTVGSLTKHLADRTPETMAAVLYVWVTAHWADAYAYDIYHYMVDKVQVKDLPNPITAAQTGEHYQQVKIFSYCIAGTLAVAAGLDSGAVLDTIAIMHGSASDVPGKLYLRGLNAGVKGKPGDCVRQYWPR